MQHKRRSDAARESAGTWIYSVAYATDERLRIGRHIYPLYVDAEHRFRCDQILYDERELYVSGGSSPNVASSLPAALLQIAYS